MWVEPKPIGIYNHSRRRNIFSSDEKNYLRGPKTSFMHTICVVCCWRSNFCLVIVTPLAVKINAPGTPSCFKRGRYPACYNQPLLQPAPVSPIQTGRTTCPQQLCCTLMTRKFWRPFWRPDVGPPCGPIHECCFTQTTSLPELLFARVLPGPQPLCHCCVNSFGYLPFLIFILMLAIFLVNFFKSGEFMTTFFFTEPQWWLLYRHWRHRRLS